MRSKTQFSINLKLTILSFFLLFLLLIILRSTVSSSPSSPQAHQNPEPIIQNDQNTLPNGDNTPFSDCRSSKCTKITPSLAQALVHYATSNITPQQTLKEISVTMRVLETKSPCNFLVFGLGHDSLMWTSLNHGGRTVFLEEDDSWIRQIKQKHPKLESFHVTYDTKVRDADELLLSVSSDEECRAVSDPRLSTCKLALKHLPREVYEEEWDLIMVDAPTGYHDEAPGRMTAIYTAGLIARNRDSGETDVFVHDVDRGVEDKFSKTFLCEGYMREQEGRLRHFTVPSHRARPGRPFCPP